MLCRLGVHMCWENTCTLLSVCDLCSSSPVYLQPLMSESTLHFALSTVSIYHTVLPVHLILFMCALCMYMHVISRLVVHSTTHYVYTCFDV